MRQLKVILFFLLQLAFLFQAKGQVDDINFRRISPPGGFTLKSINSISQDSLGYVWMATRQGLIRYHSNNTTWFVPDVNDTLSLPNQVINSVKTDGSNNVWVCTINGLCRFNRTLQNFTPFNYSYENGSVAERNVISIIENDDKMLILDASYLGLLNVESKKLERIGVNEIYNPSLIYKDDHQRIWAGTDNGEVYLINTDKKRVDKVVVARGSAVNSIYADSDGLWVAYAEHGAYKYSLEGKFIKQYIFPETPNRKTKNTNVRKILKDADGHLWFGAYEGLFMHNGTKMVRFSMVKYPGIPHSSVFELYHDKEGSMWIGTWAGGVTLVHHSDNNFKTFQHHELLNSISNNMISSFLQTNKGDILIGTEGGGLNRLNFKTEKFNQIKISDSIDDLNIKSMCKDKYGGIWIGTFRQSLWYKAPENSSFQEFKAGNTDKHISASARFYALQPCDSGVWIGTYGSGIRFYSFNTKRFTNPLDSLLSRVNLGFVHVNCLYTDSKSNLWIGALEGLIRIHLPTRKVETFREHQIVNQAAFTVYSIGEHSSNNILIGTKNNGIVVYKPDSVLFEKFDTNGLLDDKDVYGFLEDESKNLWITSNNGLVVHNPKQNTSRKFVFSDGIQSDLFTPEAVFKDNFGRLYFGGTNGFTRIIPSNIKTNTIKPLTTIHQLVTKNNTIVYPNYFKKEAIEAIHVQPNNNTFRIDFSADNYLTPEKNRYKYRLKNYYDEWIENESGSVFFTDIDAGGYVFEVKACNNDGIWNENPTQLNITIGQYWYKTTFAYLFYLTIFSLIVFFVLRFYSERIKLKRAVQQEKNQRENEEQIHEMKLKFFTNISHEFRTPLSLISWPLKRLLQENNLSAEQKEELEIVHRNSNRLLQLINQLLDFRKLEKGKSQLNLSKFDIVPFINEMHKGFSGEDKSKEIKFEIESDLSSFEIEADREKIDIILYNLLSNAYKYSPKKSEINVRIGNSAIKKTNNYTNQLSFGKLETDEFVEIAVEDSGSGIDSEDLLHVFNRFEQGKPNLNGKQKINGSGLGLSICKDYTLLHNGVIKAQSNVGKGSCFTIQLPRKQKAQAILFQSHQEFKNLKNTSQESNAHEKHQHQHQHQILVVEDNQELRRLIVNFLNRFYKVDYARDGKEALNKLNNKSIDLVVSDVMMPNMDGFEFCSHIKTNVETSHIPVILLTALSTTNNLIVGLDKGADAYLTKPFDENVLYKQIENILEQRRRIHENFNKKFVSQKPIDVGSLDNFFLKRVRIVVEKNLLNENFDMERLAEELMISRSQLHRKIKSISGKTTSEFVNLVRIIKAVELIENGNHYLNEVAYQVGFSNQSYFNKCFRKVYNVTPKEYFSKEIQLS